ncbi:hypothetical protein [Providencia huaxiensis]|uniref:hypothetical protein n=1 Tax=Providencia huaxiensis TaxID=2027290 RepID=UPI0034DD399D
MVVQRWPVWVFLKLLSITSCMRKTAVASFENDELEAIEELSGTKALVAYHMERHGITPAVNLKRELRYGQLLIFKCAGAMQGALSVLIKDSISDGVLTPDETKAIYRKMEKLFCLCAWVYWLLGKCLWD